MGAIYPFIVLAVGVDPLRGTEISVKTREILEAYGITERQFEMR